MRSTPGPDPFLLDRRATIARDTAPPDGDGTQRAGTPQRPGAGSSPGTEGGRFPSAVLRERPGSLAPLLLRPFTTLPFRVVASLWSGVLLLRAPAFILLAVLSGGTTAWAKLAVFVDGRVLHVVDARADDGRIVLSLPGGGSLTVPATRVDRVIEDEVQQENAPPLPQSAGCTWKWPGHEPPAQVPYREEIIAAAHRSGLNPRLMVALVHAESNFDPRARSRAGAKGLTQLMPAAARDHGVRDVWDPGENLRGGAEHLRRYLDRFHSLKLALAAYNAGAATVERAGGVPPYRETRQFVRRILEELCPDHEPNPGTRGGTLGNVGGGSP